MGGGVLRQCPAIDEAILRKSMGALGNFSRVPSRRKGRAYENRPAGQVSPAAEPRRSAYPSTSAIRNETPRPKAETAGCIVGWLTSSRCALASKPTPRRHRDRTLEYRHDCRRQKHRGRDFHQVAGEPRAAETRPIDVDPIADDHRGSDRPIESSTREDEATPVRRPNPPPVRACASGATTLRASLSRAERLGLAGSGRNGEDGPNDSLGFRRGGRGKPGGTRAMVDCEPGQGGNAAAISKPFMCPGAPPRPSTPPASHFLVPVGRRRRKGRGLSADGSE
jgi:hypothetical protein